MSDLAKGANRDEYTARDVRMIRKLLKTSVWNVPDQAYDQLPGHFYLMARNLKITKGDDGKEKVVQGNYSHRAQIMAARVVGEMSKQNVDAIKQNLPTEQHVHFHGTADERTDQLITRIQNRIDLRNSHESLPKPE